MTKQQLEQKVKELESELEKINKVQNVSGENLTISAKYNLAEEIKKVCTFNKYLRRYEIKEGDLNNL